MQADIKRSPHELSAANKIRFPTDTHLLAVFKSLNQKAVKATDAVLSDNSDLKELWEQNEELYTLWREDKLSIQERLR